MKIYLKRTSILFAAALLLASCAQESPSVNNFDKSKLDGIKQEGASSGGGGYSQQPTHQVLEIAKQGLADSIRNAPDEFFSKFPPEYPKEKLVQIIRDVKFMPQERRERDGSYLKMDYDTETNSLIATYDFYVIYNFPSLLSLVQKPEKLREAISNIQTDILHELSHLLGIGKSLDSNLTSEVFANEFFATIRSIRYLCENEDAFMAFFPYKSTFFISHKKDDEFFQNLHDYEWHDFDLEEMFENQSQATSRLENSEDFFEDFESHFYWQFADIDDSNGSTFNWEQGITSIQEAKLGQTHYSLTEDGKMVEVKKLPVYGFMFSDSADQQNFYSKINDTGHTSSDWSEPASYGKYTKILNTSLSFDENFSSAKFYYDLDVEFSEALDNLQLKHQDDAKVRRGKNHYELTFNQCVKKVEPFALDLFIKYPISGLKDDNFGKLFDELRGW